MSLPEVDLEIKPLGPQSEPCGISRDVESDRYLDGLAGLHEISRVALVQRDCNCIQNFETVAKVVRFVPLPALSVDELEGVVHMDTGLQHSGGLIPDLVEDRQVGTVPRIVEGSRGASGKCLRLGAKCLRSHYGLEGDDDRTVQRRLSDLGGGKTSPGILMGSPITA